MKSFILHQQDTQPTKAQTPASKIYRRKPWGFEPSGENLGTSVRRPGRNTTTIFAIEGILSFVTLLKTVTSSRHRR
jgi:hypothetical protein